MCGQVIFEQACSEEFQIFVFYFSFKEHKTQHLTINESHYGQKRHEVFSVIKNYCFMTSFTIKKMNLKMFNIHKIIIKDLMIISSRNFYNKALIF